ncbi:mitochondrial cardiolipin hydrolase [Pyrgilauda ruficollis]|uniref:mitochondrial cardiolipin hydrolase n=1 Tax=Pyrgilauda ruficollis TaxID=221976 RepID=UPI001B88451A|nr:mitochondrial cardiolipin hydrolase [Pyrgilauda ruficollis]
MIAWAGSCRARCVVKASPSGFRFLGRNRCSGKVSEPGAGSVPAFRSPAQPRAPAAPPRRPLPGTEPRCGPGERRAVCHSPRVCVSAGIQVRHDQHSGYMHHKFAIVDRRMLITGSLNWTTQAIQSNRENVLVVEDAEYVKAFQEEFERIWEEYNPANYRFFSERH